MWQEAGGSRGQDLESFFRRGVLKEAGCMNEVVEWTRNFWILGWGVRVSWKAAISRGHEKHRQKEL